MAVTMAEISKLRQMTGAGMMDCKKALTEANNDMDAAIEIIRKKGQAVAAKREDRTASEGCVLGAAEGGFAALVALKCETDFVAKNAGFVALTKSILAAALAAKAKNLDEVAALEIEGKKIADLIVEEIGKTGEKMELGAYECVEGAAAVAYNHFGNKLATIVAFNQAGVDNQVYKEVAMQVAAMNPIATTREDVPQNVKDEEMKVAIEKTKQDMVNKAVEAALRKAGFNLYIAENEEHLNEGIMKGNITEAQAKEIRQLKKNVAAEKEANLPAQMLQNIANGRMSKFYKESVLMEQEFVSDNKETIASYLDKQSKGLVATAFKRVNLNLD